MRPAAWAVVVSRSGPGAKTRLGTVLTPEARSALGLAMLTDVLRATSHARLAGTIAVLDGPAPVDGVVVLPDPAAGLDRAIGAGVRAAAEAGAGVVVVLPGDIPLVGADDIDALVTLAESAPRAVVVATDRHGTGTNALALRPPTIIAPAFGPGSAERHLAAALAAGALARRVEREGTALDIDTPADLAELRRRSPSGATAAALGHAVSAPR